MTESEIELTSSSPLKPEELQVLRAQYEKEGDYVGVQTKFNFAWVYTPLRTLFELGILTTVGPD